MTDGWEQMTDKKIMMNTEFIIIFWSRCLSYRYS